MNLQECRAQLDEAITGSGGNFLQVRMDYARFLANKTGAVLVLAYLLNQLRIKEGVDSEVQRLCKDDMWFRCPAGKIQNDLGMSERTQRTSIAVLESHGLLETDRRSGNTLWVRVNTDKLKEIRTSTETAKRRNCETQEQKLRNAGTETAKRRISYIKNSQEEQACEMRRPAGGRKPHTSLKASKQYSENVRVGATLLRDALRKANKQVAGRSDARWYEPLRLLEEVDKQKDWLSYLRRYCKALPRLKKLEEEGFKLPICNNAEQFRNLYGRWIVPVLDKMSEEELEDRNSSKSRFSIYNEETW